ncbi:MAG: hypothetical protein L0Z50_40575 [Verrucomicrobiales bacterium]|nr:hypothetical protein [Verrucomicrobiales bacterium]
MPKGYVNRPQKKSDAKQMSSRDKRGAAREAKIEAKFAKKTGANSNPADGRHLTQTMEGN